MLTGLHMTPHGLQIRHKQNSCTSEISKSKTKYQSITVLILSSSQPVRHQFYTISKWKHIYIPVNSLNIPHESFSFTVLQNHINLPLVTANTSKNIFNQYLSIKDRNIKSQVCCICNKISRCLENFSNATFAPFWEELPYSQIIKKRGSLKRKILR